MSIDYKTDAGLIPGGGFESRRFGFDNAPYAERHLLVAGLAIPLLAPVVTYVGEFRRRRSAFFSVETHLSGIKHTRFYGFGNETERGALKSSTQIKMASGRGRRRVL